uniref:Uncharacterized protein n=1 Tax=Onchocerca volvulus TaxID=6282 RepID=A0A8R1TYH2_ONCVO
MPGRALCQVQNIPTYATRKAGELKHSKTVTTNAKDGNEKNETKTENEDLERTSVNIEEKLNKTKVLKAELLYESPNIIEVAVQTNVIVNTESPKLTAEDLRSPEVSANYWRRLEEQLYIQSERKARINFELSIRLAKLNEEIAEKEEDYLALKHYISAEENIEHLSESELNENKNIEREDEEDNMFQKT